MPAFPGFGPPPLSSPAPPRRTGDPTRDQAAWGVGCGVAYPHPTPHIPLTFAKLEPLPRAGAARLLALDRPRIARQQPLLAQFLPMPVVREAQRPRDPQPHRPRLPRHAAAPAVALHVEGAERVGRGERLLDEIGRA